MAVNPCRFCDSPHVQVIHGGGTAQVHCLACRAYGPLKPSHHEAVEAWNDASPVITEALARCAEYRRQLDVERSAIYGKGWQAGHDAAWHAIKRHA